MSINKLNICAVMGIKRLLIEENTLCLKFTMVFGDMEGPLLNRNHIKKWCPKTTFGTPFIA